MNIIQYESESGANLLDKLSLYVDSLYKDVVKIYFTKLEHQLSSLSSLSDGEIVEVLKILDPTETELGILDLFKQETEEAIINDVYVRYKEEAKLRRLIE